MYLNDELQRSFYIEMCKLEKWSSRTLQDRIKSMLYERTAISRLPEVTIQNGLQQNRNQAGLRRSRFSETPICWIF
ncbi:hypothetical protein K3G39_18010 [Pontibacter sp. HSC-14F20]|nr:hypothetical protein [Pontibacter sp. HSC-14F20]